MSSQMEPEVARPPGAGWPPQTTDEWLPFEGQCVVEEGEAILHPFEDLEVRIVFDLDDVYVSVSGRSTESKVYVRTRARIRDYLLPPDNKFSVAPAQLATSPACDNGPTFCLYGLLCCCDSNVVVKSCNGLWRCGD